jgi:hypothetical protein
MRNRDLLPGGEVSAETRHDPPSLSLAEDLTGFVLWLASPAVTLLATLVRAWHSSFYADSQRRRATRADQQGVMARRWWGRGRREFMRAAAERRIAGSSPPTGM